MTKEQEAEYIHATLALMLTKERHFFDVRHGYNQLGYTQEDARFLRRIMQEKGLITNYDASNQNGLSELTTLGIQIARGPGGYKGHVHALEQEEAREQEEKNASTRLNRVNVWLTAGSFLATAIATYIAWQASASSTDVEQRLVKLEMRVQRLERDSATTSQARGQNSPAATSTAPLQSQ